MTRSPEQAAPGAPDAGRTRGRARLLHFLVRLPRPMEDAWPALASAEGLATWLTPAALEPRLGGAVRLHGLGAGRITAWDVDRVAEYTLDNPARLRFHLERDGDHASVLRFTLECDAENASEAAWRDRFEHLIDTLEHEPGVP
ncbi:hypothetical protein [Streptomyces sp. NPDC046985]|uniref:hypothetical protein n=1 Tax=Streptomyces sp. NPDC046985 TaxID=3155377 RepID=UPI0033E8100A